MGERNWSDYSALFGLESLTRRLKILSAAFANHRFERRSPIPAIDERLLEHIQSREVLLPPRRHLVQEGMQSLEGLIFLASLVKTIEVTTVFEIGTFMGATTWTLALNAPDAAVHTLDIPPQTRASLPLETSDRHRGAPDSLLYRGTTAEELITQHWSDSAKFDFSPYFGAVDLILVDAAHSREYVQNDSENAMKLMSPAGAVVWDDYWRLSPGVSTTLDKLSNSVALYRVPQTRLVVHLSRGALQRIEASTAP
ncbi:MAG: class I SAM-dependent methyltransferase [Actinomycetota bacterium]